MSILTKICKSLRMGMFSHFTNVMLETVFVVAFFGFFRCGELTVLKTFDSDINLSFEDVHIKDGNSVLILLKKSKTDPFRSGVTIHLFQTGHIICPVSSVIRYISLRGQFFKLPPKPFFVNE